MHGDYLDPDGINETEGSCEFVGNDVGFFELRGARLALALEELHCRVHG